MIERIIYPGKVFTWQEFCANTPGNSIALDGIVSEGPMFDPHGPRINFNHHEGVDRLSTRATCAQVLIAIRQGLCETFKSGNSHSPVRVYVNDPDQDVCLAVFLLEHTFMVVSTMNPLVNQLVTMEDMLDTTAAAYAFPADLPSLAKVMWVFEPYNVFRASGYRSVLGAFSRVFTPKISGHLVCFFNVIWRLVLPLSFLNFTSQSVNGFVRRRIR